VDMLCVDAKLSSVNCFVSKGPREIPPIQGSYQSSNVSYTSSSDTLQGDRAIEGSVEK
jgi:hypothetical protein